MTFLRPRYMKPMNASQVQQNTNGMYSKHIYASNKTHKQKVSTTPRINIKARTNIDSHHDNNTSASMNINLNGSLLKQYDIREQDDHMFRSGKICTKNNLNVDRKYGRDTNGIHKEISKNKQSSI